MEIGVTIYILPAFHGPGLPSLFFESVKMIAEKCYNVKFVIIWSKIHFTFTNVNIECARALLFSESPKNIITTVVIGSNSEWIAMIVLTNLTSGLI